MKLGIKLALLLLALSTIPVLVSSYLGYVTARDSLTATVMNQLTGIRRSKGSEVESYFRTIRNELRLLASSKMVVEATRGFGAAFNQLEQGETADLSANVAEWYDRDFLPMVERRP